MSLRHVLNLVGLLLVVVGTSMGAAWGVALGYGEGDARGIFFSFLTTALAGGTLWLVTRGAGEVTPREGFLVVTLAWLGTAVAGALPYLWTGVLDSFWAALFESMSGFTTTGATVFTDIEALPHGILFWRSLTHWLGGMGIIVLVIAVLPFLGVGGMQLFRAEVPGPTPERLRPRITQTAKLLWLVYAALTVAQTGLYLLGGMDLFDAVTHTFGTVATGGFSPKNASMGHFTSPYLQWVTIVFMYLAGINFALHFRAATGRLDYFRNHEWRFYSVVIVGAGLLLATVNWTLGGAVGGLEPTLREAFFQAASITTTTGYVTADYELWVPAAQGVLLALMFVGGMAGSTGGGVKAVRVLLVFKQAWMELRKHLHPRAVFLARVGRQVVHEDVLANVIGFVILYLLVLLGGAVVLTFLGMDLVTAFGAAAATVGNIGPGLGEVGATDNYGWMGPAPHAVLVLLMLVGRLEIYTVLLLLLPETWARKKRRRGVRGVPG